MSEVISFRLSKEKLREAQALEILKIWLSKGYTVRSVMTEALIKLDISSNDAVGIQPLRELYNAILQTNELLEQICKENQPSEDRALEFSSKPVLSDIFTSAIKRSAKPGVGTSPVGIEQIRVADL
jgi:hypothetical protein